MEPVRVLQIQGRLGLGGAETFLMNAYRSINRDKYQFDFIVYEQYQDLDIYDEEIKALGGHIYAVPDPNKNLVGYQKALKKIIKEHNIGIVHNQVYFGGGLNLMFAKQAGVLCRINHSHATGSGKKGLKASVEPVFRALNNRYSTFNFACSYEAGESLYHDAPFTVINNGIDLDKYIEAKPVARESLSIPQDAFVVGHIGRFEDQKNHHYLLDIIQHMIQENPKTYAILVGEGSKFAEIVQKAQMYGIEDHIRFLKSRRDIPELLKTMDVFLLPSLYEGLPIVAVEAQAAGLNLFLADTITPEIDLTGTTIFLPITEEPQTWAETILDTPLIHLTPQQIREKMVGYDMNLIGKELEAVYDQCYVRED